MPKINQLTRASQIADSDLIPKENSAGTSTESATAAQLAEYFRGKGVQVDDTLSTPGAAADAAKTGAEVTVLKNALNYDKQATPGYILRATNEGTGQEWAQVGTPTDAQTATAVTAWLDDHPEATTTVQDGAITKEKLTAALRNKIAFSDFEIQAFMSINVGDYSTQGTATDGTYLYIGMTDGVNEAFTESKIVKFTNQGEFVAESENLYPCIPNSLDIHEGVIYAPGNTEIYRVNANTMETETSIPITTMPDIRSCYFHDDVLYISNGTTIRRAEDNELVVTLTPAPTTKYQVAKRIGDYYYIATNWPSALYIYDLAGNLVTAKTIPAVYEGITLREFEDICEIDGGILLSFNNDDTTTNTQCVLMKWLYNGNDIAPYYAYDLGAQDGLAQVAVYVDANADNGFQNGAENYPFSRIYDAVNCIRYKYGGKGIIYLSAGTYSARFKNIDVFVLKKQGETGTVHVGLDGPDNSRIVIVGCSVSLPGEIQRCDIMFQGCTFTNQGSSVALYNSTLRTSVPVNYTFTINSNSVLYCTDLSMTTVKCVTASPNTFKTGTTLVYAGDDVFTMAEGSKWPEKINCLFKYGNEEFSLTFNNLNTGNNRQNPISASYITTDGKAITVQLLLNYGNNNLIRYYNCIIRDLSANTATAYRPSGTASDFPYILKASIEF